ncbi:hypothetical protein EDB89DRAFT_2071002 [Lactarius sanguifluus]|nr:hypothetical protein EDB89DRAFT_2071002 [Lactarius sanguifluus]
MFFSPLLPAARSSQKSGPTPGTRRSSPSSRFVSPLRTASTRFASLPLALVPSSSPYSVSSVRIRISSRRRERSGLGLPLSLCNPAGFPPPTNSHGLGSVQQASQHGQHRSCRRPPDARMQTVIAAANGSYMAAGSANYPWNYLLLAPPWDDMHIKHLWNAVSRLHITGWDTF